jgi:hypothetical protein
MSADDTRTLSICVIFMGSHATSCLCGALTGRSAAVNTEARFVSFPEVRWSYMTTVANV